MDLAKAKEVANSTWWGGDIRVNFVTLSDAAKFLASRVAERREQVAKLDKQNMKPGEIAAKLGVSVEIVRADLKRVKT